MNQRPIEEWWSKLEPSTQRWFMENPGCVILPRTIANVVRQTAGRSTGQDQHGKLELSAQDRDFIRAQGQIQAQIMALRGRA
jgi:hypothetical protein